MDLFKYRGYVGTIEPQAECKGFFGKLLLKRDLVNYEANTVEELEKEFRVAADDYLDTCKALGHEPNKLIE